MKGKLIKENNGYTLFVDGKVFGDTDGHQLKSITNRLSLKNCQAIELGYDLDELAHHNSLSYTWLETDERDKTLMSKYGVEGFKAGFQKALELMGDKKFSEQDIDKAYWAGMQFVGEDKGSYGEFIQSLQQTEWDVEIEMEDTFQLKKRAGGITNMGKPKLDTDGCLILKGISK
jgi:hypothetical protein